MPATKIVVERITLTSDKAFESVLNAVRDGVGHPDMTQLWDAIWKAETFSQVESVVTSVLSTSGLMQFGELDDGRFIAKERGERTPKSMRILIGNPLIMKQMTELVPDAAAYAPVTILIDEREGKVQLSYDRMASLLSSYNSSRASGIAEALDRKIETLMNTAI